MMNSIRATENDHASHKAPSMVADTCTTCEATEMAPSPPTLLVADQKLQPQSPPSSRIPIKLSPPSSKRLRSDLLYKLGVVNPQASPALPLPDEAGVQRRCAGGAKTALSRSMLGSAKVVKAPLKACVSPEGSSGQGASTEPGLLEALGSFFKVGSPASSVVTASTVDTQDSDLSPEGQRRRRLSFDEQVSVVHIPRREDYSNRIAGHLWHDAETLKSNIMRNTVEYAADGWNWEQVLEEDQHIVCTSSGELVHPVHQEIARLIRQQQGLPEDAPVVTPFLKNATTSFV